MVRIKDICDCRVIHEDKVALAKKVSLLPEIAENLCQTFKALGDNTRLKILWALEKQEMCVCDLAALLGISESAASHQMRILRNMNLVKNRREGQVLYYRLVDDHVMQLIRVAHDHVLETAG